MNTRLDIYEPCLSIGVIAKKLNLAVQTVRLYEREGLILPHKTESGRRMYSFLDLEKLHCIRQMITEHGVNLQGIKKLLALIPCWQFMGGLDEDCRKCPVYYEAEAPCWHIKIVKDVGDKCKSCDCRSCQVYRLEVNCSKLKEIMYGNNKKTTSAVKVKKSRKRKTGS